MRVSTAEHWYARDLYVRWGEGKKFNAERVYYWHNDSEVKSLVLLPSGEFDIYYADGTIDTIGKYETIIVQKVNWE